MADIYKKISNKEQKNRPVGQMSASQSEKVQNIVQNFVTFFKGS
jgi:hypothetical protein